MFAKQISIVSILLMFASFHCVRLHAQAPLQIDPSSPEGKLKGETRLKGTSPTKSSRVLTAGAQLFEGQFGLNLEGSPNGDIKVIEVRPETRAAAAGVHKDDVVIAIEGIPLKNSRDLASYVAEKEVSSSVALTLLRDGKSLEVLIGDHFTGLGMTVRQDKSKRAYVWTLIPSSPAAAAGIHGGDLFMAVADKKTDTYAEFVKQLTEVLASTMGGDLIPVLVIREGSEEKLKLLRPEDVDLPPSTEKEVPLATASRPERIRKAIAVFHAPVTAQSTQEGAAPRGAAKEKTVIAEKPGSTVVETHVLGPVGGVALFVPVPEQIEVRLELSGLSSGQYVATIHEFGDIADILHGSAGTVFGIQRSATPLGLVGSFQPDVNGNVVWSGGQHTLDLENMLGRAVLVSRVTATPNGPQYTPVASGVIGIANPERGLLKARQ